MSRQLPAHLIGADLKEIILDTAEQLLARRGFSGVSMSTLAEEIGIAKGTTYLYFRSKEELALGVIERSVFRVFEELQLIARNAGSPETRLREMIIARVLLRHRNVAHYEPSHLAELLAVLGQRLRDRRKEYAGHEISIFSRVIEEGVRSGAFAPCDATGIATAMFWASEGLLPSHVAHDELGEIAIAGRITVVARLLVDGITRTPPLSERRHSTRNRKYSRAGLRLLCAPFLGGVLVLSSHLDAQTPDTPAPLRPVSVARIDSIFARFDFDSTPGCAVGVDSASRPLIRRAYGMASLELHVPNAPKMVYYGASLAKQFTATAVLLLEQDGRLALSDPVRKYIPELSSAFANVSLEQLLGHTSGIRDYPDLLTMAGVQDAGAVDVAGILRILTRQKGSNFPPGTDFAYNNGGYVLLAEVVRRVSGRSLPEFTSARIFQPLRMTGTRFASTPSELIPDRATGHRSNGREWLVSPYLERSYGDGGLFTTVDDLLLWAHNLATGAFGGRTLVNRLMTETVLQNDKRTGFGLGLEVRRYRGYNFVGHGGRSSGAQNYAITSPSSGVSIVVLCNARDIDAEQYAMRVAGAIFPPLPPVLSRTDSGSRPDTSIIIPPPDAIRAAAGTYFNHQTLAIRTVGAKNGQLVWIRGDTTILRPQSSTTFRFPNLAGALVFSEFRDGHAQRMTIVPDAGEPTPYARVTPFTMPRRGLADYAGSYASDEVQGSYRVSVSDNALSFESQSSSFSFVAFPVMKDGFKGGEDVLLTFHRDRSGRVTGFDFNTGRARNVPFVRLQQPGSRE